MANYLTNTSELTSIADAIRLKGGTSSPLEYPEGFVSAIEEIYTSGDLQSKSVTPSETAQHVVPDMGYDGLSSVDVSAIPDDYVGSGVARKSGSDLTASGATITVPAGYYASQTTKNVASGTEGTPTATKGTVSNHSVTVTPSVTNVAGYISGGTHSGTGVTVTASELESGTKSITQNGTGIDVSGYSTVDVSVSGGGGGGTYTATIANTTGAKVCYVTYNNVDYYHDGDSFTFSPGDTIILYAASSMGGAGIIKVDDTIVAQNIDMAQYSYIAPENHIVILLNSSSSRDGLTKVNINLSNVVLTSLSVTANGTYTPLSSYAYSQVTVSIPAQAGAYDEMLITRTISGVYSNSTASYIGQYAFAKCNLLTSVDFSNCREISSYAFYQCSVQNLSFPSVVSIYNAAFNGCTRLTDIYFPNCTTIDDVAFGNCYNLSSISFPKCTWIGSNAFGNCSSLTTVNFPSVSRVGGYAFISCIKLNEVNFPIFSQSLSNYVFAHCPSLTTVNIPNTTGIGDNTFASCTALTSVDFPSCTSIGNSVFSGCSSLTYFSGPKVTYIGGYAFYKCINLTDVYIPSVTSFAYYAFASCNALVSIDLPNCSSLAMYLFSQCINLQNVSIPNVVSLPNNTFVSCSMLSTITLPKVSVINAGAFSGCQRLLSVYLLSTSVVKLSNSNAFTMTPISTNTVYTSGVYGSVYVPSSLVDAYKSSTNWTYFSSRIVGI